MYFCVFADRWVMGIEQSSCYKPTMKANVTVFLNRTSIQQ